MKRIFILTLILSLTFSLICCGGEKESLPSSEQTTEQQSEVQSEESSEPISESKEETSEESNSESISQESVAPVYWQVTFDTDGGTEIDGITVEQGQKIPRPEDPKKSSKDGEYEFVCWLYQGEEWDFDNDVVTSDVTLVAEWEVVAEYLPPFLPED